MCVADTVHLLSVYRLSVTILMRSTSNSYRCPAYVLLVLSGLIKVDKLYKYLLLCSHFHVKINCDYLNTPDLEFGFKKNQCSIRTCDIILMRDSCLLFH